MGKKYRIVLFLIIMAFTVCIFASCKNFDDEPEERVIPVTSEIDIMTEETLETQCEEAILPEVSPENSRETSASREEVLEMGYTPCGNCKP